MKNRTKRTTLLCLLLCICAVVCAASRVSAQPAEPVVAIHVSELTQALETMPAKAPTPTSGGATGYEWWIPEWHYFVMAESLKEALRSDGTPFVEVSDADIAAGRLRYADGSPRYPIVISLASEAVANNEIAPLREYVEAGGMLFAGSSAFTRNPDGTTRGDFAFAGDMGVHMAKASLQNWYVNQHFSRTAEHRLTAGLPANPVSWRMPLKSQEIALGVAPNHTIHSKHYVFQVYAASGTTVLANCDAGPVLATRQYGKGNFVYHGAMQPLIGHGVYDPAMYSYLIYRNAIEWAFETAGLPIIKLSPWQYDYNAAFVVRHDFENNPASIRSIESSAAFEYALGVKGDYYFCTGTLREEMADKDSVIDSLRRAVTNYRATIGSHNGGLKNPVVSLPVSDFDYWHWGPDEVLDITPPGYESGKAYARKSISSSFNDLEGWLAGVDNGRAGCGAADNCPRIWAAPYFNGTREGTYEILDELSIEASSKGEQKIGPFPHWTLSYETKGKHFDHVTLPASDWYVGTEIPGALEWGHTTSTMQAAVDFYYNLGSMINLYGHEPSSNSTLAGAYARYGAGKSRMWSSNAAAISAWWQARSSADVTPVYTITGDMAVAEARISGAIDPDTAIEVVIPGGDTSTIRVLRDDVAAGPADYRIVGGTVKVRVGSGTLSAKVQYHIASGDNPAPGLASLSPSSAGAGGTGFTLTVTGSGYVGSSVVQWNGADLSTTFVSGTQLTAAVPASALAAAGTAQVTVFNPAPGGGTSGALTFTITVASTGVWTQTDWTGGTGQAVWVDATRYASASGIDSSVTGQISLASGGGVLFSDDFTRPAGSTSLSPWTAALGTWTVTGGVMQGTGARNQYSHAYVAGDQWSGYSDYRVQGRIQLPAGSFGGGIGGRVDAATGAHYGAWVYPTGSAGGSNMLKLWKFRSWTDLGAGVPMQQVTLPAVGTGWHTLQIAFLGNRIQVSYDGAVKIDVTDNNYDSRAPYAAGGVSADWWTSSLPYTITVDDVSVSVSSSYPGSGVLTSSAFDGGTGVAWQTVSWDETTSGSTRVCVRTRAADLSDQLAAAAWSGCYAASGSAFTSGNHRWIQYQAELTSSDPSASPLLSEIQIAYASAPSGNPVPLLNSLSPTSATAGGAGFTLTLTGSGYVSGSVARWNGADLATNYVSGTQLTASVPASALASAGTAQVTVFNPSPGGGSSNALAFTITAANNPVPALGSLSPSTATAAGAGFTLTVTGSGFLSSSVVRWSGTDLTTTFVSGTQVTASVPASALATAGTAQVTVFNPAPGGGTSNALTFTITASGSSVLFSDDFTRPSGSTSLSPWTAVLGTWTVTGGVMQGTGARSQYSYATIPGASWTDYTVQGRIQLPAGSFGGGIGGRVDAATGAHYGAWVYPTGSAGGSNMLKLWKFRSWTDIGAGVPMQQVSLPAVGTGWHTLQITFLGNRIQVSYDGAVKIDVTDNNYDSRAPYAAGGISADWWTSSLPYTITVDDVTASSN